MMLKRLAAILLIYVFTCIAWGILGATIFARTHSLDTALKGAVAQIWGNVQTQLQPSLSYKVPRLQEVKRTENGRTVTETKTVWDTVDLPISSSSIDVKLHLDPRQKGLLWYATYRVAFAGRYQVVNDTGAPRRITFVYSFPAHSAVYDDFRLMVGDQERKQLTLGGGLVTAGFDLAPGASQVVSVAYTTQGLDQWWYDFGENVHQVRNFALAMATDFDKIDFPPQSISPTAKEKIAGGWRLTWAFTNLLTSVKIGLTMPQKLNPGPWVGQVTLTAPISLFLFLFFMFVVTSLRKIPLHPMHYFFLSAAYFSFHLLLAYLVDHLSIEASMAIASVVAVLLTTTYMRLVVDNRFAFGEVAIAQLVYLVLFSYTFFLEGYTGLAITILGIATLLVVMQMTGRLDWDEVFGRKGPA
ncbi:MAG: inner membrane CreD family protein [Candidatus Sericytochromatia bacterium]|nr:inner membrane CreD family protein [Candidatus Tanganyikabacteria bacterium]